MKQTLLVLTIATLFISCSEKTSENDSKENKPSADTLKKEVKFDIPANESQLIFQNRLEPDELPNDVTPTQTEQSSSVKKFLKSRNGEDLNYLFELIEFNENGDTTLYSYTSEWEMNWKDECHFNYDNHGKLVEQIVVNCVYPTTENAPILEDPENFKNHSSSKFKYSYTNDRLSKIEYYNRNDELVNTRIIEYNDHNLVSRFLKHYENEPDTNEVIFTYNENGLLIRKDQTYGGYSFYKGFYYNVDGKLTDANTDYTSVHIDYFKDSIVVMKKVLDLEYKVFFLKSNGKVISKDETYKGIEFYHEGYMFDSFGRITATHINSPYTEGKTLEYLNEYK